MKRPGRNLVQAQSAICFFLGLTLAFGSTTLAWAQFTTARLSGTVSDPSGAVLAGATVSVQDLGTGYSQTATSESTGQYVFPSLRAGT